MMIDHPRGPLTFRGGGYGANWAIIIAILGAIIVSGLVMLLTGCAGLRPAQTTDPTVTAALKNIQAQNVALETKVNTVSNQIATQITATDAIKGSVGTLTNNTGLTPMMILKFIVFVGCEVAAYIWWKALQAAAAANVMESFIACVVIISLALGSPYVLLKLL
jgi:hypothetical protein